MCLSLFCAILCKLVNKKAITVNKNVFIFIFAVYFVNPVFFNHSAVIEWQSDVWDERIQRLGVRKFPSGINHLASDSTPPMPLLALDTIKPIRLPVISAP